MRFSQIRSYPRWKTSRNQQKVCLELGSGPKKGKDGWITVDLHGADISYDLRRGIPLPDNSVDAIYTSHMFEHIPYKRLKNFIGECYRVLKSGGYLSVCVPNARNYIDAYVKGVQFLDSSDCYAPAVVKTGSLGSEPNLRY